MAERPSRDLHYPIRAVARMTGISIDTLRAWERRYDAVIPRRNDRGRVYSEADVARLRQLGELVRRGHAIGTVAGLKGADLDALLASSEATTMSSHERAAAAAGSLDALIAALDRYDLNAIETTLNRDAFLLPPHDLIFTVIVPMLQEIGRRWQAGTLRPAQEHLVSAIVRTVLGGLLRSTARPDVFPRVVFATPAGERHEFGLLCGALLTASAGLGVVYLGTDLPADEIADAATAAGARVVMVSLTTPGAVSRGEVKKLAAATTGLEMWIGGPEAGGLLSAVGERGLHVTTLAALIPMLSHYGR